jgi:hypothetical protein
MGTNLRRVQMKKKTRSTAERKELYVGGDMKVCAFELPFGKDVIRAGDNIKIRNTRGTFRFIKVVHNVVKDVTWVDCMDNATGEFKSFYVNQVKTVIRPKRSYRKKVVSDV